MKKILVIYILELFLVMTAFAQVPKFDLDFETAYNACLKANNALDGGYANVEQLSVASKTLEDLEIEQLLLNQTIGTKQSLKGHFVFTSKFMNECIKNKTVYEMSDEYSKLSQSRSMWPILMETVLVPANSSCIYEIENCNGVTNLGCVAEPSGYFSWSIKTFEYETRSEIKYNDTKDFKKGRRGRRLIVNCDSDYKIQIELINTTSHDCSFCVIIK